MKKLITLLFGLSVVLYLNSGPLYAQKGKGGGQGQGKGAAVGQGAGHSEHKEAKREQKAEKREQKMERREDKMERKGEKLAERIDRNPELEAKVKRMLPAGMTVESASSGFKNQGQFIAALHVSKNLNIPFRDLKAKMTGPDAMSLGQAIKSLRPEMSEDKVKAESKKAEKDAKTTDKEAKKTTS